MAVEKVRFCVPLRKGEALTFLATSKGTLVSPFEGGIRGVLVPLESWLHRKETFRWKRRNG